MNLPAKVTIVEAGPRDGLQNEARHVPSEEKVRLIEALAETGIARIEATSFVHPKWIPQLADADEVLASVRRRPGVSYAALVPNLKGLERAVAAKVDEAVLFLSASEGHSKANINKTIAEALETYRPVAAAAKRAGLRARGAISTAFGCPFDGDVDPGAVARIARELHDMGCDEVAVCDTVGYANPRQVEEVVGRVAAEVPIERIALHFHDTRGTALANILAGLQAGVTVFDGAVGGLGGCPYAGGATGNVATEDMVNMLEEMGVATGVDLDRLIACAKLATGLVGRSPEGHVARTGRVRHRPAALAD
jgi:hydroxymethylglutaryl-CoA lyase